MATFNINNIQFDYNSKIIISYLLLSLIAWFLNTISHGKTNKLLFSSYRSSPLNPLSYVRLFTHSIGHENWDHFVGNFLYILSNNVSMFLPVLAEILTIGKFFSKRVL